MEDGRMEIEMNLKDAEKIYKENNCSLFIMSREDFDNYLLYKQMDISVETEKRWRSEEIEKTNNLLRKSGDILLYNKLYELASPIHDKHYLDILTEAMKNIKFRDNLDTLTLVETILGRKPLESRSGLIFWAFDIGEEKLAEHMLNKAKEYIDILHDVGQRDQKRIERDKKKISEIKNMLAKAR